MGRKLRPRRIRWMGIGMGVFLAMVASILYANGAGDVAKTLFALGGMIACGMLALSFVVRDAIDEGS